MQRWLRRNLFQDPFNSAVSLALIGLALFCLLRVIEWALINAVWRATSYAHCQAIILETHGEGASGACWAALGDFLQYYAFGFYPEEHYWRPTLAAGLAIAIIVLALTGCARRIALLAAIAYPVVAHWLFFGGWGLEPVETVYPGGFALVLILSTYAAVIALLCGVALALCREHLILPVRMTAAAVIQIFGAIPTIVLIYSSLLMFFWVTPPGSHIGAITLAAFAIGLSCAAPVAIVIRRSLTEVPEGLFEAARALGFTSRGAYWRVMFPLALTNAAPQIATIMAKLVRDSSLVLVVGLQEPIGLTTLRRAEAAWRGGFIELFLLVGAIYWLASFAITALGRMWERKLARRAGGNVASALKAGGPPIAVS